MSKDLAVLPKGWKVVRLGEVVKLKSGTSRPDNLLPSPTENANVPVFGGNGILGYTSQIFSNDRQLVIGRVGAYCGCVHIANAPNWITDNALYSEKWLDENIVLDFVADCLRFSNLNSLQMKGGQPLITQSILHNFYIALPPLEEQRAIAITLRTIQTAKEARQKELALERERKAALMDYLFTHGTRNEPRKQTELGEIPESWEVVELEAIAEIQSGGTPSRTRQDYYGGNISWVKTLDLNEGIVNETEEKVTALGLASIRGKIRPVNSVMVAMYGGSGTVGKCGILGIPAATNQAVCAIEPNPSKFDSFYLLHYMLYFRRDWMRYAGGTRKDPNIGKGIIESTKIPFPSLQEQQEIADVLSSCDAKIATLEREIKLHDELFRAMLEELMTGQLSSLPLA